jgi:hypothetical protein
VIRFLYTIALLELFIGGGGRLLAIGPVSARMVLFAPYVLIGFYALFARPRISRGQFLAVCLVLAYLLVHLPAVINGAIRGVAAEDMLREFQQSLYIVAAPFFAMVLDSTDMVERSARLVLIAGLSLAFGYLCLIAGGALGLVDVLALYAKVDETQEFVGRGEGLFFYKGFLYLGVAMVFLISMRVKYWLPLSVAVAVALVATLTRGFLISTSFAVFFLLMTQGRRAAMTVALVIGLIASFVVLVYLPSLNQGILTSQGLSNGQRISDVSYMVSNFSAGTFLFGEGFGALINDRVLIENTFLWATWKLGFAGLVFWFAPLFLVTHFFFSIPARGANRLACAYFFGTVLVYVQTMTNPYLNNPIGLSFVMVAMFSLRTLADRSSGAGNVGGEVPMNMVRHAVASGVNL